MATRDSTVVLINQHEVCKITMKMTRSQTKYGGNEPCSDSLLKTVN